MNQNDKLRNAVLALVGARAMADRLIKESRIATSKVTVARKALVRAIAASDKNAIVFDGVKYTINEVAEEGRALNWLDEEPFVAIVLGRTG